MKTKSEILYPEELKKRNIKNLLKKLNKEKTIESKKMKSGILYDADERKK